MPKEHCLVLKFLEWELVSSVNLNAHFVWKIRIYSLFLWLPCLIVHSSFRSPFLPSRSSWIFQKEWFVWRFCSGVDGEVTMSLALACNCSDVCFHLMQWLRSLFSCCLLHHLCLVLYRKTKATHHFFCFVTCALCECVFRVKDWTCYYVLQLACILFFMSTVRYGALIYRLGVSKQIILLRNHIWMSFQVLIGINTESLLQKFFLFQENKKSVQKENWSSLFRNC